jgi:hypothetical protein
MFRVYILLPFYTGINPWREVTLKCTCIHIHTHTNTVVTPLGYAPTFTSLDGGLCFTNVPKYAMGDVVFIVLIYMYTIDKPTVGKVRAPSIHSWITLNNKQNENRSK